VKVCVEFLSAEDATRAVTALTALGHLDIETYAPFPLTDEGAHAPLGSFALSFLSFGAGVTALIGAYLVQWYANVASYPLNIGGRPAHAGPAFVPATFESICLLATLGVFAGFLLLERLPRLWQAEFEIDGFERSSVDRYWIVLPLAAAGAFTDEMRRDILPLGPVRIVLFEEDA